VNLRNVIVNFLEEVIGTRAMLFNATSVRHIGDVKVCLLVILTNLEMKLFAGKKSANCGTVGLRKLFGRNSNGILNRP
jgi:hypothetical protein